MTGGEEVLRLLSRLLSAGPIEHLPRKRADGRMRPVDPESCRSGQESDFFFGDESGLAAGLESDFDSDLDSPEDDVGASFLASFL